MEYTLRFIVSNSTKKEYKKNGTQLDAILMYVETLIS